MCNRESDPSQHDEPLEDTVDWAWLRQRRLADQSAATDRERSYGIPVREGVIRREADRLHHSVARRGWLYRVDE